MTEGRKSARVVTIRGRVQRVGFRAFVEDTAAEHGIAGWVRNRRDGSVEALFVGDVETVDAMIEGCRRGPPAARVDAIEPRDGTPADDAMRQPAETFSVLPTV